MSKTLVLPVLYVDYGPQAADVEYPGRMEKNCWTFSRISAYVFGFRDDLYRLDLFSSIRI